MIPKLVFLLSAGVGLVVSGLLSLHHIGAASLGAMCADGGGCDVVLASRYAKVAGIPLAYLGLVFYAVAAGSGLVALATGGKMVRGWLCVLGGVGVVASAGFVGIQAVAIRAFCPLCLTSAAAAVAMLLAAVWTWRRGRSNPLDTGRPLLAALIPAVATPALAITAVLWMLGRGGADEREVLGTFDGRPLTLADFRRDDPDSLSDFDNAAHQLRLQYLDRRFAGMAIAVEARKRGITRDALIQAEVDDKLAPDRQRVLQTARELSPDDPDRATKIAENMLGELRDARRSAWIGQLLANHKTEVLARPPLGREVELDPTLSAPGFLDGSPDATLQLVVFSDLQCPLCAELNTVLAELRKQFGDDLAVRFRHFPLSGHEFAEDAAVVAEGIVRAGKSFPEYKSALYAHKGDLDTDKITVAARATGLTGEQLSAIRADGALLDRVRGSAAEARRLKLSGAPVLILNNRVLGGYMDTDILAAKLRQAGR